MRLTFRNFDKRVHVLLAAIAVYALSFLFPEMASALDITRPSFVSNDGINKLDQAGTEISKYIAAAFGVMTGIAVSVIAFLAINGKMEEVWERFKNIVIGVLIFLVGGTAVFAIV